MDVISNMLISIKNGQAVQKETVDFPYSDLKMEILKTLLKEKFIKDIQKKTKKGRKMLEAVLDYKDNGQPRIKDLERVSKPSRRVYLPAKKITSVAQGRGIMILSTPNGILTDKEARAANVGGEVICKIW
jgi:small subunit ribosomal protein S8